MEIDMMRFYVSYYYPEINLFGVAIPANLVNPKIGVTNRGRQTYNPTCGVQGK